MYPKTKHGLILGPLIEAETVFGYLVSLLTIFVSLQLLQYIVSNTLARLHKYSLNCPKVGSSEQAF